MSKNNIHVSRMKAIRPYVNFNYNLNDIKKGNISAYDKRKIKEYFDEISELNKQPRYKYNPRNADRRAQAAEFTGQSKRKGFKYILLPTEKEGEKPDLKFNKDGLRIKYKNVTTDFIPFDKNLLIKDPRKAAQKALNTAPNADAYGFQVGQFESINHTGNAQFIIDKTAAWMNEYKDKRVGEWLNGIKAHTFTNQRDFSEYRNAKKAAREEHQRIRKNKRAALKRKQAKK